MVTRRERNRRRDYVPGMKTLPPVETVLIAERTPAPLKLTRVCGARIKRGMWCKEVVTWTQCSACQTFHPALKCGHTPPLLRYCDHSDCGELAWRRGVCRTHYDGHRRIPLRGSGDKSTLPTIVVSRLAANTLWVLAHRAGVTVAELVEEIVSNFAVVNGSLRNFSETMRQRRRVELAKQAMRTT